MSENSRPILCLDFDGVCHSYSSGWQGAAVIPDDPVPGLFEFLDAVKKHFDICVFSSRSHQPGGIEAMRDWFAKHFMLWLIRRYPVYERWDEAGLYPETWDGSLVHPEWILFPTVKPSATVTLDDQAITFCGQWPSIEELRAFKPWNRR